MKTNAAFLANALSHPAFLQGEVDTGFIEAHRDALIGDNAVPPAVLEAAAARLVADETPVALLGFRLNAPPRVAIGLQCGGADYAVHLTPPIPAPTLPAPFTVMIR